MQSTLNSFFVEGIPPLPNRTRGQHWSKTYRDKLEWENTVGCLAKRCTPILKKANIHFDVYVGTNRKIDPDNLMSAINKPTLDALQKVGVIRGDSIDDVELSYSFSREKPKGFRVTLKSSEL